MIDKKIIEEAAKDACAGLINKEYFDAKNKFIEGATWYGKQVENLISNAVLADSISSFSEKEHPLNNPEIIMQALPSILAGNFTEEQREEIAEQLKQKERLDEERKKKYLR